MLSRRRRPLRYIVALSLIPVVLYIELLVYHIQPLYWPALQCPEDNASCVKVLFVADPQIEGDNAAPFPWNCLFSWDSDRFVQSTFSVVMKHFRPDVIVYLGDLMDEGSSSTMVQFHAYAKRLMNIFNVDYPVVQVWTPGDNDIGGENEPIQTNKIAEFNKVFVRYDITTYKHISFIEVNGITHTMPAIPADEVDNLDFRIVISHYAVTPLHVFGSKVHNKFRPHIYFCAHDHRSKYFKYNRANTDRPHTRETHYLDNQVLCVNTSENATLYEVFVPTCSYRMGTTSIGFGAAVIENSHQQLRYTVFWSPSRFPYLIIYVLIAVNILFWILIVPLLKKYCNINMTNVRDRLILQTNSYNY